MLAANKLAFTSILLFRIRKHWAAFANVNIIHKALHTAGYCTANNGLLLLVAKNFARFNVFNA